jgi:hypothetical protein
MMGLFTKPVEINLLRTVLLETGNWTDTGHPTGRKVAFVNTYTIEGHFFNFTTSGQWMWDELKIMVPSNEDPYLLLDAIQKTVAKETEANVEAAGKNGRIPLAATRFAPFRRRSRRSISGRLPQVRRCMSATSRGRRRDLQCALA